MITCSQKRALIEKLGVLLESKEQLAPIAAQIKAYIILKGKSGTTFDDLVRDLCASKSTISTHLNHLQDLKKIVYFTKIGDRKKYYIINKDSILQSIDEMVEAWDNQKQLHLEIRDYKNCINKSETIEETSKFDLDFHDDYIEFLDEATKSLQKLKAKIIEKNSKI
ncbi:transcriptional regulator [Tenacibaculum sp. IB213877]|uniref:GbsR/MarR family transcriptional regulator n=1 Tax=Tenacibaculum sp. IB213877 TaxID=3097351 RepID=UPI002A5A10F4|nr:transcriptional regulator [Tenacibaculum sp. IB213877]MDY0779829.1 transcriptional regulator [Tenacibaculum sp. IB213877]